MANEIETLRASYQALQIRSGLTPAAFKAAVSSYAHEAADGEALSPQAWVQGAREWAWLNGRRVVLGSLLGSLRYMGQCRPCGRQFMSTHETVYVPVGSSEHFCLHCAPKAA